MPTRSRYLDPVGNLNPKFIFEKATYITCVFKSLEGICVVFELANFSLNEIMCAITEKPVQRNVNSLVRILNGVSVQVRGSMGSMSTSFLLIALCKQRNFNLVHR